MKRLPNLFLIGAAKSATTTIYEVLNSHPQIFMSPDKEPNYFSKVEKLYDGQINPRDGHWLEYTSLFKKAPPKAKYIGEASTNYTKYPHFKHVPWLIKAHIGNPKIIYILREPVARTISHYKHVYTLNKHPPSLVEAVKKDPILVDTSRYIIQLEQYWEVFGKDEIHIMRFEDIIADFTKEINTLMAFLRIDADDWAPTLSTSNDGNYKTQHEKAMRLLGSLSKLGRFLPRQLKRSLISNIFPKTVDLKVSAEETQALRAMLFKDTERLNHCLGRNFYTP